VLEHPIIFWLIDNICIPHNTLVCIPYNQEYSCYNIEDKLKKEYPHIRFIFIELTKNTRGAAETILIGLTRLYKTEKDAPIICLDSDNIYFTDIISLWNKNNQIITFEDYSPDPIYSYVKINHNGDVVDIIEKEKISNNACSGAYGFKSFHELMKYCDIIIQNEIIQKNEFYTSGVIKEMLQNHIFTSLTIDINKYACLGTPAHIRLFTNNVSNYINVAKNE
jgi:hypothetical protein